MPIALAVIIAVFIYCVFSLMIAALPYIVIGIVILIGISIYRHLKGL